MNCWTGTITWAIAARSAISLLCRSRYCRRTRHGRLAFTRSRDAGPGRGAHEATAGTSRLGRHRLDHGHREQPLPFFPWVRVENLASKAADRWWCVGWRTTGRRSRLPPRAGGDLCRSEPVPWQPMLPSGPLAVSRARPGAGVGANAERRFRPPVG